MVVPFVTDTHALVWYMTEDPYLSKRAKRIFEKVDNSEDKIYIPSIVFFELLYLIEKGRIVEDFNHFVNIVSTSINYRVEPLCLPIIQETIYFSEKIKDPWDRLIAATAKHLNMPLLTRDKLLKKTGIKTVW